MLQENIKEYESKLSLCNYEDILFSDFLKKWLESIKFTISKTTYSTYKFTIYGVICPYFEKNKIKLADLKANHIQEFYAYKSSVDKVSNNTILHYQAYIHNALQFAVKSEMISKNVAENVTLPKKQKFISKFYTATELKQLLEFSKGTDLETVILIAVWFGLRRGEIIGLKWENIDFENKTLSVEGTMVMVGSKQQYSHSTKSRSSIRAFPMSNDCIEYFKYLKKRQEQNKKELRGHYINKWRDFVCVKQNGQILNLDYVTRAFPKLCEKYGLPKIRLHELRHSNISLLISSGASIKEVQEWAGHSSYSTTADIYAHIQAQNKIKLTQSINNLLTK